MALYEILQNFLIRLFHHKLSTLNIALGTLLLCFLLSINYVAKAEELYLSNCVNYGDGYINLPDSDWCLEIGGDIRSRYHIHSKPDQDLKSQIDARGRLIIDSRRQSELGPIQTHIKFSGNSKGEITLAEGFANIGNLMVGKTDSHGNLTYGAFAMNANHGLYHADNSTALFGYTFNLGGSADISVSLEDLSSEMPYINFDLGTSAEVSRNWGKLGIASGVLIHYLEEGGFNKEHPAYLELTPEELDVAGEPEELGTFGIYLGGGGEFPIPKLANTNIGFTGFYYRGGASKLGLPKRKLARRFESGDNAGRPMDEMGNPISQGDFAKSTPDMIERFKDFTLVPTEDTTDAPYIQQQYIPWGIAVNGGFSHEFNPFLHLNLNGGYYNTTDYDYTTNSFMVGASFDINPLKNMVFSFGGEFENSSIKYSGDNDAIAREFTADNEGKLDPSFSTTILITTTF